MSRRPIRTEEVLIYLGVEQGAAFIQRLRKGGLFEGEELDPGRPMSCARRRCS